MGRGGFSGGRSRSSKPMEADGLGRFVRLKQSIGGRHTRRVSNLGSVAEGHRSSFLFSSPSFFLNRSIHEYFTRNNELSQQGMPYSLSIEHLINHLEISSQGNMTSSERFHKWVFLLQGTGFMPYLQGFVVFLFSPMHSRVAVSATTSSAENRQPP